MNQPGIRTLTCFTATCGCGDTYEHDDVTLHYTTEDALLADLRRSGWDVFHDRLRCPDCRDRDMCARTGHDWGKWKSGVCTCHDERVFGVDPHDACPTFRQCERCCTTERRDPVWSTADDTAVARLLLGGEST